MISRVFAPALIGIAASALGVAATAASPAAPAAQPAPLHARQCFLSREWRGWKASPDAMAIYIRVGMKRIYRLDLGAACPMLRSPGVHLVNRVRGSSMICDALDFDLKVSDPRGFSVPCLVRHVTPLTQPEVQALPKDLVP